MMDDFVITRLDLSLCCYGGYGNSRQPDTIDRGHERIERVLRPDNHKDDDDFLPCLTLGLPDSITPTYSGKFNSGSPCGGASSMFSDSFLKLDKAEEGGAIDEGSPRKKLRLSKIQTSVLEDYFNTNTTLNSRQKQDLADKLNLRPRQVEVWFQNRRARRKLKQTEADCELLRKCCETLEEDNARLKMELRKLKSTNHHDAEEPSTTSPVSFCPSCETGFRSPFSPIDRPS